MAKESGYNPIVSDPIEPFMSLGVALGAGLLIGLEREQSRGGANETSADEEHPDKAAAKKPILGGVRTHPLYSLGGGIAMMLSEALGAWAFGLAFAGFASFVVVSYAHDRRTDRDRGITSEAAFLICFLLGALATAEGVLEPLDRRLIIVASLATVITLLLSTKEKLHGLAERMSRADIVATIKFLIVTVLMLPLLPDRTYGPLDVLNPYKIGLMIVLIAGISFVGYIAIRTLGARRGLGLTGFVGGLASSTAVTLSFSGKAKEAPELAPACALAVVLASAVMAVRVIILVGVVNSSLLAQVAIPMGAMTVVGLLASGLLYRKSRQQREAETDVELTNPFELSTAVKFGLLYGAVLFVSKAATEYFGNAGTYIAGFLAGLTNVDAITLSMANLSRSGLAEQVAITTIIIGAASNTVVKAGLAMSLGRGRFAVLIAIAFGAMLVAGALGVAALWIL